MPRSIIPIESLEQLDDIFGHSFQKKDLLHQALTHRSAINEKHPDAAAEDYRSLAFIGDAALKYAVSMILFKQKKTNNHWRVGDLHNKTVQCIMNEKLIATACDKLKLERFLVRGNGLQTIQPNMYATCLEAILGVIAIECQDDKATRFQDIVTEILELDKWLKELETELNTVASQRKTKKNRRY